MCAMSDSRLLPPVCALQTSTSRKPFVSLIAGSVVGYGVCIAIYLIPIVKANVFNVCMLFACMAYIAQCVGFIHLRVVFPQLSRSFNSPVGIAGACVSMVIWLVVVVSIVGFQDDYGFSIASFVVICVLFSVYYFLVSQHQQVVSSGEKEMLYFAKERELLRVSFMVSRS